MGRRERNDARDIGSHPLSNTGPAISTADGVVTLDLGELVKQVGKEFGLSLDVLDKLPEDVGMVTIVESDELGAAQDAVRRIETLSVVLFVVVVTLYAAAVYLAEQQRREAIREVGLALVIGSVLMLVGLRLAVGASKVQWGRPPAHRARPVRPRSLEPRCSVKWPWPRWRLAH